MVQKYYKETRYWCENLRYNLCLLNTENSSSIALKENPHEPKSIIIIAKQIS